MLDGSFNPSMLKSSMIDGIAGIKPNGNQIKNGTAMKIPRILNTLLRASTMGLRLFN